MGQIEISGDAEAAVLRDVETFTDELAVACRGVGRMGELRQLSEIAAERVADHSPAAALLLLLDNGQKQATHEIARQALRDWFLMLPDVKASACRRDEQIRRENEDADAQDQREREEQFARVMDLPAFPSLRREAA